MNEQMRHMIENMIRAELVSSDMGDIKFLSEHEAGDWFCIPFNFTFGLGTVMAYEVQAEIQFFMEEDETLSTINYYLHDIKRFGILWAKDLHGVNYTSLTDMLSTVLR